MRTTPVWTVAAGMLGLSAAGCDPQIIDTPFQSYSITLRGPDAALTGTDTEKDPFGAQNTAQYQITLKLWEDARGTIPYGKSLNGQLPEQFKGFSPTIVAAFSGNKSSFTFGEGGNPLALPQLSATQKSFFVSAEVIGLNQDKTPVARARCGVQEVKAGSGKVECHPFYGLIGKFNPIAAPKARYAFAAAALPDGRVVVAGGKDPTGSISAPLTSVQVWDPRADDHKGAWVELAQGLSTGRYDLTAAANDLGQVLFAGGRSSDSNFQGLSTVDVWSVANGDGSATGGVKPASQPLTSGRTEHAMAPLAGDAVLVVGGRQSSTQYIPSGEVITADGAPRSGGNAGQRTYPCAVQVAPSKVVVCGGNDQSCTAYEGGDSFIPSGTMSFKRVDPKCAAVDGSVIIVGGAAGAGDVFIERWSNDAVANIGRAPSALTKHAVAAANGKVLVTGGVIAGNEGNGPTNQAFLVDPNGETPVITEGVSPMPAVRSQHQMVSLNDGTIMVIGGKGRDKDAPGAEIYVMP